MLKGSSFIMFTKFTEKNNISFPVICTRMCAYQGVRNVSFSENFASVLNEWSLKFDWVSVFIKMTEA